MQLLLNEDLLLWSFHACSTLPKNKTPYGAWNDSMYRQRHASEFVGFNHPSGEDLFDSRRFDIGNLADIFLPADTKSRSLVQRAVGDTARIQAASAVSCGLRQMTFCQQTSAQFRRGFTLVSALLQKAAEHRA